MGYEIKLDIFEGPLDLLLFLIKKNEIDIYNIPIALITEQYLEYLDIMRSLNLDLAGEYLLLASTLLHIKSTLLLPVEEAEKADDEADPRTELVKQLLEYQRYKEAAAQLETRPLLDRDIFTRSVPPEPLPDSEEREYVLELNIFDLVETFHHMIANMGDETLLEIDVDKMSLSEKINEIIDRLTEQGDQTFAELLGANMNRRVIVYTFLAILELMKQKMVRVYQASSFGVIRICLAAET